MKADEAYEIGERGHPVRAYLDPQAIVGAALGAGADAVYPGYGFLSENPELAEACARAGITFVGPPASVLELTGNKARAIAAAREAGLPVLTSTEPSADVEAVVAAAEAIPFPVFVKAVAGGGGRGMRRVADPADLRGAVQAAMREAESAFGDPTVFCEQAVVDPRHIAVQILADGGVPAGRHRAACVRRDEPAHPGRAHGDRGDNRGGHRRRPGAEPAADRGRGDPRRSGAGPGHHRPARGGAAIPDHHRGPGQRLPPDTARITIYRSPGGTGIRLDGGRA